MNALAYVTTPIWTPILSRAFQRSDFVRICKLDLKQPSGGIRISIHKRWIALQFWIYLHHFAAHR